MKYSYQRPLSRQRVHALSSQYFAQCVITHTADGAVQRSSLRHRCNALKTLRERGRSATIAPIGWWRSVSAGAVWRRQALHAPNARRRWSRTRVQNGPVAVERHAAGHTNVTDRLARPCVDVMASVIDSGPFSAHSLRSTHHGLKWNAYVLDPPHAVAGGSRRKPAWVGISLVEMNSADSLAPPPSHAIESFDNDDRVRF